MKPRKIGLLILILGFGLSVETAFSVRHNLSIGPMGCRILTGRFQGPSFSFVSEEPPVAVPAETAVEIENAFGEVKVTPGEAGRVSVSLRKVVYMDSEERARAFALGLHGSLELSGTTLRVTTNRRELERARDVGFETHLDVRVPPGSVVKVQNEHGRVDVEDAKQANVWNSYGAVRVERVAGPVDIDSRHGDVQAGFVGGALKLQARFGSVTVNDVSQPVTMTAEHGDVSAERVGALNAKLDYGDLTASDVRGALELVGQHASLKAQGVQGRASVQTSFRNVELQRVGGEVRVKAEHGSLKAEDIRGPLTAQVTFDDVDVARVDGVVEAQVEHGGFRGAGLKQGARIKASGDEVVLESFEGPLDIETRRGGVRLSPERSLVDSVSVRSANGDIQLSVPADSRFELEARAERGEVRVDLPNLNVTESGPRRVSGRLGAGGKTVRLVATHGDVTVESPPAVAAGER